MTDATGTSCPLFHDLLEDGALLRITLDSPPGNIIDRAMVSEIRRTLGTHTRPEVRAVLFEHTGKHFSFGASVEEHRAEQVGEMLPEFHELFRALADLSKPLIAVVRGQCLGGGMELASFCHFLFASPSARFAQPEIQLAVVAPVASIVLPMRVGQGLADELLLTGRAMDAEEAHAAGLVRTVTDEPGDAAMAFIREHLLPRSGAALAHGVRAARDGFHRTFRERIDTLERLYLHDLMGTEDAVEGIESFCAKRTPSWRHA